MPSPVAADIVRGTMRLFLDLRLTSLPEFTLGTGRRVDAICYLCDRNHEQYAGALSLQEQIEIVRAVARGIDQHRLERDDDARDL